MCFRLYKGELLDSVSVGRLKFMENLIKLKPYLKSTIWGGQKLKSVFDVNNCDNIAEAWTISNKSTVACINGKADDFGTFNDYLEKCGAELPVLIKYINSADNLSIQVHPSNQQASILEGQRVGKAEFWYILDCEPDAYVYLGFDVPINKDDFLLGAVDGSLLRNLHEVPIEKGDYVYIPSGTVHSMSKGITLLEISQNSDLTYRIYDYNRKDYFGNARQLHLDKALQVLDFENVNSVVVENDNLQNPKLVLEYEHFSIIRYCLNDRVGFVTPKSISINIISGKGTINGSPIIAGDAFYVEPNVEVELVGIAVIVFTYIGD